MLVGLAYVGIIGGGLAFVLFFNGLARTTAEPAAFWHDTLVVWVSLLAVVFLRERLRWWNVGAIALLVVGQAILSGGIGHLAADGGELLVLSATLLWAVEVVVAKKLLETLAPSYCRRRPHGPRQCDAHCLSGCDGRPQRTGLARTRPVGMDPTDGMPPGGIRQYLDDRAVSGQGTRRHLGPGG